MSASKQPPMIGDIFYRAEGSYIDDGSEIYQGMELLITTWRIVKVTPCGAWLQCVEQHWKKPKFALTVGALWVSATKKQAIQSLVGRKIRHLSILNHQTACAEATLAAARAALEQADTL